MKSIRYWIGSRLLALWLDKRRLDSLETFGMTMTRMGAGWQIKLCFNVPDYPRNLRTAIDNCITTTDEHEDARAG
jgi:hypothetical protein